MGLRAYASAVLLGGALVAGPLGCSKSGGDVSGAAGASVTSGSSGTTGASGTSGSSATAGASGAAGTSETTGTGGTSGGEAGGASGTGGSADGTGGGAGSGGASGAGGQPPVGDGGADSGPTDAGPDGPACTPDLSCRPVNSCRTGTTSCATGTARCVETGYQPNGTACGLFAECLNGICNTHECDVRACTPSNPCHTGTFSCVTGIPACQDNGTPIADGTRCGTDKACLSGDCVACSASDAGCSTP